jgi:Na+-transporting NADH:ubiquinone oxidoreductase subunit A
MGADYVDLKHSLAVAEGERVRLGQTLFTDRRYSEVRYTAPGSGYVRAINRGAKRRLASVVLELDGDDAERFPAHEARDLANLQVETVREILLRSGLWTALRSRPYGRVPPPNPLPHALFITAMDTNPLAADPAIVIAERAEDFHHGVTVLSRLATGTTYLCQSPSANISGPAADGLVTAEFQGPHPAGLPGTHIHRLTSNEDIPAWYVGYQDVIAIGYLFSTGELLPERVIALGGPGLARPRLVRARIGACLDELLSDENVADCRVISGSVLSGRRATQTARHLGRYHQQVSVLPEIAKHEPAPGFLARLMGRSHASSSSDTAVTGRPSGMLPMEAFERVWPLTTPPSPLLRALLVRDTETARTLGCLTLDEEDLALCSYVCPAKYDYGSALRETLRAIERSA